MVTAAVIAADLELVMAAVAKVVASMAVLSLVEYGVGEEHLVPAV